MTIENPVKEYLTVPLSQDDYGDQPLQADPDPPEVPDPAPFVPDFKWSLKQEQPQFSDVRWEKVKLPHIAPGYQVSDQGNVMTPKGRIMKFQVQGQYYWVGLKRGDTGKTSSNRVDRLILTVFSGYEPEDKVPGHVDGDTFNNRADNLYWREPTPQEAAMLRQRVARQQGVIRREFRFSKKRPAKKQTADKKQVLTPTPVASPVIEATRRYRLEDVAVEVDDNGQLLNLSPDPNDRPYSAHQTALLVALMGRVGELQLLLGVR